MKDKISLSLIAIAAGILVMVGMRIADWTISRPPILLYACMHNVDSDSIKCVEYLKDGNAALKAQESHP
jgi:hypothetical protein